MTSVIKTVSFDAADAFALATFRAGGFGSDVDEDSSDDSNGSIGSFFEGVMTAGLSTDAVQAMTNAVRAMTNRALGAHALTQHS
jgi:hypothetical protein